MNQQTEAAFELIDLRCERQSNPVGLDVAKPRLSWRVQSDEGDFKQSSYAIKVGTTPGASDLWDSGRVASNLSHQIEYGGSPVPCRSVAHWQVEVEDSQGRKVVSGSASWETGAGDWPASWIQATLVGGPKAETYSPYFRKEFSVEGQIVSARLYATALGLYRITVNGSKAGDLELTPGWTEYRKRLRYQTYDVTSQLTEGANCIGAVLGDGWYAGHIAWRDRQYYGDRPKLLAFLVVELAGGRTLEIGTDASWKWSSGSIQSADLLMGETQDLRLEPTGWELAGFEDQGWTEASVIAVLPTLEAQNSPGIKIMEEIKPAKVEQRHGRWIFDMGQNMVGRVKLQVEGEEGQTLTIKYAERLDKDGSMYTVNYRAARSTDYVTLKGGGLETFEPALTFHGFQYVEVGGLTKPPEDLTLTGIVLHSDWQPTCSFQCSDPLINQLFANIRWGWKGNSVDVPTDCPQRDERLGWTGDAQVFVRTASLLGDVETFFEKYVADLSDSQSPEGSIPMVAPDPGIGSDGGPAWADAFIICPWVIYRQFGDTEILRKNYAAMSHWIKSLDISSKDLIRSFDEYKGFKGFGDWLSTNAETPIDLIGTAFYAYTAHLMSKVATVLGEDADSAAFTELSNEVKTAFQKRFVTGAGLVASGSQTGYVLALHFDLLPEDVRAEAVKMLVNDIGQRGWKLSTGFVGTPYLLHVLTEAGRLDVAYKLLNQKQWPSWLYPVTQGATTIWERWDGWTEDKGFQDVGMNSFNHYAYGAVGDWLVSTVCGINLDGDVPAFQKSTLAPRPGGGLTHAGASLATRYGVLSSDWTIREDRFVWHVSVPPNTTAQLTFPPEASDFEMEGTPVERSQELGSGRYVLSGVWSKGE